MASPLKFLRSAIETVVQKDVASKASQTKGGWEGWLQVELSLAIQDLVGAENVVEREVTCYVRSKLRADIWFTYKGKHYLVELKCEGRGAAASTTDSARRQAYMRIVRDEIVGYRDEAIDPAWKVDYVWVISVGWTGDIGTELVPALQKEKAPTTVDGTEFKGANGKIWYLTAWSATGQECDNYYKTYQNSKPKINVNNDTGSSMMTD